MTNLLIFILSLIIGIPLGDWYYQKKCDWEDWKREAWKTHHPSSRSKT